MERRVKSNKTFELTWEQTDHIVIEELKSAIEMNLVENTDESGVGLGFDDDLLAALNTVLAYIMPQSEYEAYFATQKKTHAN